MSNSSMLDQIGSSHMMQGMNTTFVSDRFGSINSALSLNGGYAKVPSGVYFKTPQFSVSVWVSPQQVGTGQAKIFDFSTGKYINSVIMTFQNAYNLRPGFQMCDGSGDCSKFSFASSTTPMTLNKWQFLGNFLF